VSLVTNQDWHKDWAPIPEPALQVCIFRNKLRPIVVRQGRRILQEYKEARRRFAERRVKGGGAGQEQSKKESRPATE
jgi:hypothetical protein